MAFVNAFGQQQNTAASTIATPSTAVTTGNTLLVFVSCGDNPTITVADGVNNYSQIGANEFQSGQTNALFIANNITGGTRVITATLSGPTHTFRLIMAVEISGRALSALDQHTSAQGTSTTSTDSMTSGPITPSVAACDEWAFVSTGATPAVGTGWQTGATVGFVSAEHRDAASGAQISGTWTDSVGGHTYEAFVVSLLPGVAQVRGPDPFLTR